MKRLLVAGAGVLALAGATTAVYLNQQSGSQFSFQQSYNSAANGAVIQVPAGQVVVDSTSRASSTIFGSVGPSAKSVTFECADPDGKVTMSATGPRLTIKASNITIDGRCFDLLVVRVGEPGDTTLTATNVLVENAHIMGSEVTGAQDVSFVNDEIGPNVGCYAQGRTGNGANGGAITPKMWCDPNGPPYEAMFANRGTSDLTGFETYVHNSTAGGARRVTYSGDWFHDVQSKDSFNIHTGGPLVWNSGTDSGIVFRDNRFERLAVEGILVQGTNGMTLSGNQFGPPMEPVSNTLNATCTKITDPCALVQTSNAQKELIAKSGFSDSNWTVSGNTFCHGTRADGATVANVTFDSNDLGIANAAWAGATYTNNTNAGAGCSLAPLPWPPGGGGTTTTTTETTTTEPTTTTTETTTEPPPPDSLPVSIQSQTETTVTLSWTPVDGIGYRFLVDGKVVSHTWDKTRSTVKFSKVAGATLEVQAMAEGVHGSVISP